MHHVWILLIHSLYVYNGENGYFFNEDFECQGLFINEERFSCNGFGTCSYSRLLVSPPVLVL